MPLKLVILDRDGVLNVDRPDYVKNPDELVLIPGAAAAVAALAQAGLVTALATNQACVAKGLVSLEMLDQIHQKLQSELAAAGGRLDRIYVAPEASDAPSGRRKPAPTMLLEAMQDLHALPQETAFIGDAERDWAAAQAAGVRFLLVRTGHGLRTEAALAGRGVPVFADLGQAAAALVS
jgi:D-glycero-D-manno-heptose 1,7-bisphosphate phosphatase